MDFAIQGGGSAAAPRPVPDLRPAADAAASARAQRPPVEQVTPAAPVSLSQAALVAQGLAAAPPADESEGMSAVAMHLATVDPSTRVLKPYGVNMLPSSERPVPAAPPPEAEEPEAPEPPKERVAAA